MQASGSFEEAYLGIFAYDDGYNGIRLENGVYVAQVALDGPSNLSAIKVGDIITKIDNTKINKMSQLRNYIYTKKPGDEVNLSILRNKKEYNLKVKLGKKT